MIKLIEKVEAFGNRHSGLLIWLLAASMVLDVYLRYWAQTHGLPH